MPIFQQPASSLFRWLVFGLQKLRIFTGIQKKFTRCASNASSRHQEKAFVHDTAFGRTLEIHRTMADFDTKCAPCTAGCDSGQLTDP